MEKIIENFKIFGFTEIECRVYIHLLKKPGDNGTQISKEHNISRSACYNALENLEKKGYIILIPSDNDRKNYKVSEPSLLLLDKKKMFENAYKELEEELYKMYNKSKYEEIYTIDRLDNTIYKLIDIIEKSKDSIVIIGDIEKYMILDKLNMVEDKGIMVMRFDSDEKELIVLSDSKEILISGEMNSIYTKNSLIIEQIVRRIKLEMEKNKK